MLRLWHFSRGTPNCEAWSLPPIGSTTLATTLDSLGMSPGLDWATEPAPQRVEPFQPREPITTEEAAAFFSEFASECEAVLSRLLPA
jgi:hypothetical protein